ncbi:exported hypothetical protein [Candidatus Zixiibacteriota bacterium]|nr:exported hypothetical protein [candidate division Zixibacteria bacterium]
MNIISRIFAKLAVPLLIVLALALPGQVFATFSIVAVDTLTGAVGGAGASCIDGSVMINDCVEGIGASHTQAYYLVQNKNNLHNLMAAGIAPDSIIHWLENNDYEATPEYRQYGVVTLANHGASAAYTGAATTPWTGHITGPAYSIQGNILILDGFVLDSIKAAFIRTDGPLEDKLMAALQGANVPGADTRCYGCNKPAISAFIKVVHPGDGGTPYLFLNVNSTVCAKNPIDSLQKLYDHWKLLANADPAVSTVAVAPLKVPASDGAHTVNITVTPRNIDGQYPRGGATVSLSHTGTGILSPVVDNGDGTFSATLTSPASPEKDTLSAIATAGDIPTPLDQQPIVAFLKCGDANANGTVNILDVSFIISWLYKQGPAPDPLWLADPNASGSTNILDVSYLISFLYKNGPGIICPSSI